MSEKLVEMIPGQQLIIGAIMGIIMTVSVDFFTTPTAAETALWQAQQEVEAAAEQAEIMRDLEMFKLAVQAGVIGHE